MNKDKILKYSLFLIIFATGIFLGKIIFGGHNHAEGTAENAVATIWTCSMHPQIRQDKPGKCPICAMDLIPLKPHSSLENADPDVISMSDEAIAIANIQTTVAGRGNPVKEIRLYGIIKPNERRLHSLVSQTGGRIESLAVNYAGETVRKGQTVAAIYSPDLLNAQNELLEARKMASQPALLAAAREKLRLWKLSDSQIDEIERSGRASAVMPLVADASGIVVTKRVEQGDYIGQGGVLFDLADLSSVWAEFDAYEQDLPYLKMGDRVDFSLQTIADKTFTGRISFISPLLDSQTRTAKVRVEAANPNLELKPEMYASATIKSVLKRAADALVVPKSAVLWTGRRSVVYVRQPDSEIPTFKMREITLGESLGDEYVVLSGLAEGETVVSNGAFAIDASAQLEGKPSMMNASETSSAADLKATAANLQVQGVCEMCKERIEKMAKSLAGVSSAIWNIETKQLNLQFDSGKTSLDAVAKALAEVGHDNGRYRAPDKVYEALPPCCKYR
ncbi:MAG: efflux RND transporter periplasmic adaptor subunit [Dysgonamonadaceae bacterium]|jgi:Cu(I)/Ag(I) efflux system membrane fusion protein|nr:efflux RND transporter periplasmic adaptor subunit [Dysgonamonadaceae bacterium]